MYEKVAVFKQKYPETNLKKGSLIAIFEMNRYEKADKMAEYLLFLLHIGVISKPEFYELMEMLK